MRGEVVGKRGRGIASVGFDQNSSDTCMNIKCNSFESSQENIPCCGIHSAAELGKMHLKKTQFVPCQSSSKVFKCLDHCVGVVGSRFDMTLETVTSSNI